jgi:hypothetical protein
MMKARLEWISQRRLRVMLLTEMDNLLTTGASASNIRAVFPSKVESNRIAKPFAALAGDIFSDSQIAVLPRISSLKSGDFPSRASLALASARKIRGRAQSISSAFPKIFSEAQSQASVLLRASRRGLPPGEPARERGRTLNY